MIIIMIIEYIGILFLGFFNWFNDIYNGRKYTTIYP